METAENLDFPDFFCDDFVQGDSMNADLFEDSLEVEMNEPFTNDPELDGESDEVESQDDEFTAMDTFFLVGAMGFAYGQGG
jgi:hypothetical protein